MASIKLKRLVLVKRYLWGSLIVATVPLLLLAGMYDRYSSDLLQRLVIEKTRAELEVVVVQMSAFINSQVFRLENLVDLPSMSRIVQEEKSSILPDQLLDFLYLESSGQDIYAVELYNAKYELLHSVPSQKTSILGSRARLPLIQLDETSILGPFLPNDGAPAWFLIRKDVLRDGRKIGAVALKIRLASLTELASPLFSYGVYEPILKFGDATGVSVLGMKQRFGDLLATSREIVPSWRIGLHSIGANVQQSRTLIRYLLLLAVALSTLGIVWLFFHMSSRLANMVLPLTVGARAIAKGDLDYRVPETGAGEIKSLAKSFNLMSERLNEMIASRVDVERRAALGNLAAGMAHEIRNPLTTIRTTVYGLMRMEKDQPRLKMFEIVNEEITRVDGNIEEFLDYARPRAPKIEMVAVKELFKSIEILTSGMASEISVKMSMIGDSSLKLNVDPAHIRQVLMNVVLNAFQAMPRGGHLIMHASREGEFAKINIKDTGIGISEEHLMQVKVPFFTTKKAGTGLGLSICTQLIKANGGRFELESEIGKGTSVTIIVPTFHQDKLESWKQR